MQDLPFLQGFMPQFMVSEYLKQEDTEFYADLIAVASGENEIPGAISSNVEKIMGWVTNLRAADYDPNGIVMNPVDVFSIFINKGSTSGDYTLPPGVVVANNGGISIYGLPVYQTTFIPEGKALVGDWNRVGIVQVDGLAVLTDDRGDNFDNNTVTFKAEARVALAVLRTDAFIYGDLLVSA
jgi:HK97 family phage major capsid protein